MNRKVQFGLMKKFWEWVVMVTEHCECKCHCTVHSEIVKVVILCMFYHNKSFKYVCTPIAMNTT